MDRKDQANTWQGNIVQVANLTNDAKQEDQKKKTLICLSFLSKVKIDPKEEMPLIGSNVYVNVLPKDFCVRKSDHQPKDTSWKKMENIMYGK